MKNYVKEHFWSQTRPCHVVARDYRQLPDHDIIDLHTLCMTNGFHHITVPTVKQGRDLMEMLLSSLSYYNTIAVVSTQIEAATNYKDAQNVYTQLKDNGWLDSLDQYFIYQFDADFVWIEATKQLQGAAWFGDFIELVVKFDIDKRIPIVIMRYSL